MDNGEIINKNLLILSNINACSVPSIIINVFESGVLFSCFKILDN